MPIRSYKPQTTAPGPARAPALRLGVAADSSGGEAVGNALADVAQTLERARQAQVLTDARLAMTEGFSSLNTELAQDTEFRTMPDRYGSRLDDLGKSVIDMADTPGLKRQIELEAARGRVAIEARVADRAFALQGDRARATLAAQMRATASAIPQADSEAEAAEFYRLGAQSIDSLVEAGHISAEEAERARVQLDADVSKALVLDAINTDPAAAAARLAEPGAFGLEEIERQQYLASASRTADSEARQARTVLERQVDTARRTLVSGEVVPAEDLDGLRARVAGTDLEGQLEAAIAASEQLGRFSAAAPAEREAFIAARREAGISIDDAQIDALTISTLEQIDAELGRAENAALTETGQAVRSAVAALGEGRSVADLEAVQARAAGTAFAPVLEQAVARAEFVEQYRAAPREDQARLLREAREAGVVTENRVADEVFLDELEAIDAAARSKVAADPIAYGIEIGLPGAAPLDLADQSSIENRIAVAGELYERHGAEVRFLSEDERKRLEGLADEGSPEEQLATMVSIIDGFKEYAPAVLAELGDVDPVVRRAGELVLETGADDVAGLILRGRKAMAAGDERYAPSIEAVTIFEEELGAALGGGRPGHREDMIEAAKAYYAARAPGRVQPGDLGDETDLLAEGLQRVLGGVRRDGRLYGGVQQVNGRPAKLPHTLDARTTEAMLDDAMLDDWRAASLTGGPPRAGSDPELPEGAVLQWTGEGSLYRVGVPSRRGGVEFYQDPRTDDGHFYVDLDKLGAAVTARRAKPRHIPVRDPRGRITHPAGQ